MAISKMQKILLITGQERKKILLETVQGMQVLQVKEVNHSAKLSAFFAQVEEEDQVVENENKDELLKKVDEKVTEVTRALEILEDYLPKRTFKERFRTPTPEYSLQELGEHLSQNAPMEIAQTIQDEHHIIRQCEAEVEDLMDAAEGLDKWKNLEISPNKSKDWDYVEVRVGTIPSTEEDTYIRNIRNHPSLDSFDVFQNDDEYGVVLVGAKPFSNEIEQVLRDNHFEPLRYRYKEAPAVELQRVQVEIEEKSHKIEETHNRLSSRTDDRLTMQLAQEYYYAQQERIKAVELATSTDNIFALEGWIPVSETDDLVEAVEASLGEGNFYYEISEVREEEIDEVPIRLENNAIAAPFENMTLMYGHPHYTELDPTNLVALFYMIFFGMMLADVGYGLVLWLGTFLALKLLNLKPATKKNIQFFHLLSYPTIIVGLIYGSFFGVTIPTQLVSIQEDSIAVLGFSFALGIVHIIIGLILNVIVHFKNGRYALGVKDGLSWIGILVGIIVGAIGGIMYSNDILTYGGFGLAILSAILIVVISIVNSDSKVGGLFGGLYDLYGITTYVGDIVSYSRLMALGLSGASIGAAFNMMIGFLPPAARFTIGIVLLIFLHLFNMGLSSLSGYVHSMRLIFVEFFGKFYQGTGKPFEPLEGLEENIKLKRNENGGN